MNSSGLTAIKKLFPQVNLKQLPDLMKYQFKKLISLRLQFGFSRIRPIRLDGSVINPRIFSWYGFNIVLGEIVFRASSFCTRKNSSINPWVKYSSQEVKSM